jgi:hypothetical protein
MEIQSYRSICCALTDYEPLAGLIVHSLCKSFLWSTVTSRSGVWNEAYDKGLKKEEQIILNYF